MIKKGDVNKALVKESMKEWMNEWETDCLATCGLGQYWVKCQLVKQKA